MKPLVSEQQDELDRYLGTDPEMTDNVLAWWNDRKASFPCLSRMALDYLCIPGNTIVPHSSHPLIQALATSVDVEHAFSQGRLLLPHTRSRLSAQTVHSLLCLGTWSGLGIVRDTDIKASSKLPDLDGDKSDFEMPSGWDAIADSLASL